MSNQGDTTVPDQHYQDNDFQTTRKQEFGTILFLVLVVAPAIAVGFVAAYGFIVWMLQLIMGPPTY